MPLKNRGNDITRGGLVVCADQAPGGSRGATLCWDHPFNTRLLCFDAFDCSDWFNEGDTHNGVYTLLSDDASHTLSAKDVYCDMEIDGGG